MGGEEEGKENEKMSCHMQAGKFNFSLITFTFQISRTAGMGKD